VCRVEAVELERLESRLEAGPRRRFESMLAGLAMGSFSMGDYYGWQLTASMESRRLRHRREVASRLVHKAMLFTNETSLARPKAGRLPFKCDDLLPHP
jgi:hypothetical protein